TATSRRTVSVSCPTFQFRAVQFRVRHRHRTTRIGDPRPSSTSTAGPRKPTHVRVCALRLHGARMCYGASSVRPPRVTMRGEGIATPWTETMTAEDKKMRRKKRERGTSNTP
ncbi:hypothetical protein C8R44DRAFT_823294, partial [Mycena epipterygia]